MNPIVLQVYTYTQCTMLMSYTQCIYYVDVIGNIDTAVKRLEGWGPLNTVFSPESAGDQAVRPTCTCTYHIYTCVVQ